MALNSISEKIYQTIWAPNITHLLNFLSFFCIWKTFLFSFIFSDELISQSQLRVVGVSIMPNIKTTEYPSYPDHPQLLPHYFLNLSSIESEYSQYSHIVDQNHRMSWTSGSSSGSSSSSSASSSWSRSTSFVSYSMFISLLLSVVLYSMFISLLPPFL